MKKFFPKTAALLGSACLVFSVAAQSASVWKVTKDDTTLYLGGTLHVLSQTDYPLPEAYNTAFENADTLVFETDIAAIQSPAFQQQSMAVLTYQDGTTLAKTLSEATLARVKTHLDSRGVPLQHLMTFKPSLLSVTLSVIEMQRMGLTSEGVDAFYYAKGKQAGKKIAWFETPEEQLNFIATMGEGEEDAMINYTLDDLEDLPSMINQMRAFWRAGDMQGLYKIGMEDFAKDYPKVFDDLLINRNKNWLPDLLAFLQTPETEFVLVGSMHIPGKDGLIDMLTKHGYTVTQLQ